MKSWKPKDPDDVLDYPLSWAAQMAQDADTIASYEAFVSADTDDGSLVVMQAANGEGLGAAPSFTDTATNVWLSGGTAGVTYEVVNRITTAAGRQYDHTRKIKIKEL
jgi:hypothetical protein